MCTSVYDFCPTYCVAIVARGWFLKIGTFIYRKNIKLPPVTPPMPFRGNIIYTTTNDSAANGGGGGTGGNFIFFR